MELASAQQQDTGFWDLVYILYVDFAEAAGVGMLRGLVPHYGLMEKTLMVRLPSKSHRCIHGHLLAHSMGCMADMCMLGVHAADASHT